MGNLDDLGIAPQIRIRNYLTAQGWTVQKCVARNSGTRKLLSWFVSQYPLVNIQKTMEDHHLLWENSLFLWPCSIAMLNYQRVICGNNLSRTPWGSVEKKSRFVRGNTGSGQTSGSVSSILGNLHVVISTQKQRVIWQCQNLVPLVNIKIAGKWMFIPLKMVLIGIDPYPFQPKSSSFSPLVLLLILSHSTWALRPK